MHIGAAATDEHCVEEFLRCVSIFIDESNSIEIKVFVHLLNSFGKNCGVDKTTDARANLLNKTTYVAQYCTEYSTSLIRSALDAFF